MSQRNKTPPALEPYLRLPPEASLTLLTSTLGCSANWLTAHFVSSALANNQQQLSDPSSTGEDDQTDVLLVSWLRDLAFWKSEMKRCTGTDLSQHLTSKSLLFLSPFTTIPQTSLSSITAQILSAITVLQQSPNSTRRRIFLILDAPDTFLATTSTAASALSIAILSLRAHVHATILVCSADSPLLSAATSTGRASPLELASAEFLVSQAHNARLVMGVRALETGAAGDVSGVLRVTLGGASDEGGEQGGGGGEVREAEWLYLVPRDGNVRVFGRGEG